ncbi:hypothetical protein BS50DRAFT_570321 [Corynespora cassiicola Philippines]|uniref:Uncharacterized protein n=1 Tax=Corynespora cassiicola Philippines TaxID=1448308 RepID=A0A2T2NZT9_CORCC|nr:hypothetical protein BS50DRAFT_570321 [Corynespora cassiicola Philippines]
MAPSVLALSGTKNVPSKFLKVTIATTGIGSVGHLFVKFAAAMGCHVVVLSISKAAS